VRFHRGLVDRQYRALMWSGAVTGARARGACGITVARPIGDLFMMRMQRPTLQTRAERDAQDGKE
jgi:hypothetical protein